MPVIEDGGVELTPEEPGGGSGYNSLIIGHSTGCGNDGARQFQGEISVPYIEWPAPRGGVSFTLSNAVYYNTAYVAYGGQTPVFLNLPNGRDYVLQAQWNDNNGGHVETVLYGLVINCQATATCDVLETNPPVLTHVTANGGTDGTATLWVASAGPLEYQLNGGAWRPYATHTPITGLAAGTYAYAVRQAGLVACQISGSFTLTQPPFVCDLRELVTVARDTSGGQPNGQLTVTALSSYAVEYAIQRDGGRTSAWQSSGVFPNLPAGGYTVYARDARSCTQQGRSRIAPSERPVTYTGFLLYRELEEYYPDNGLPTGRTTPNVPSNPNYVAPQFNPGTCPLNPNVVVPVPIDEIPTTPPTTPPTELESF
jgi:hypothetical protein